MSYLKIGKYTGESLTASTYVFEQTLPVDYVDISDVYMWFQAQDYADMDYVFCRDGAMNYIAYNGGFTGLTEEHKLIAAKNFCVSKPERDTVLTDAEQEQYWELFVYNSQIARNRRWDIAKSYVSYRLTPTDSSDLGESTDTLTSKYLRYGIESELVDGKPGLYDWVKDEYSFSGGTGFSSKTYYTTDLRDGLIERLDGFINSTIQETPTNKMVKPSEMK